MTNNQRTPLKTLRVLALLPAVFLAGCGLAGTSTAPEQGGVTSQFIRISGSELTTAPANGSGLSPIATQMISATEGGTLQLGRMTLTFPPGALVEDTQISMRFTDPSALQVELLPHGTQFQRAVTLSADLQGLLSPTAQWVGVAWWNESASRWDQISRQPAGSTVDAELWHFSDYAAFQEG